MKHYKSLHQLHADLGFPAPEHPLISLVRCNVEEGCSMSGVEFTSDYYIIGFKKLRAGVMLYGKTKYDHDQGSMSFIKPRQIMAIRDIELEEDGFLISFHEDFLNGHFLHNDIKKYGYFDYEVNEALHLSPKEEQTIWELFHKIDAEYNNNQDEYSRGIMLAHIDSILKYAQRFYKRQFINRSDLLGTTVSRFNEVLSSYFEDGKLAEKGLPTVHQLADQLNVSSRYLSDLLKQETGKTAIELIHIFLMGEAKNLLMGAEQSVAEIAYTLGFENPPYFSRLFRKEVGMSPNEFKKLNLS